MYIKLNDDNDLIVTLRSTIRRGENLHQTLIFLIPELVGEIAVSGAVVFLAYVRPDGSPDIVTLERMDEMYNESYYQYTLPVTNKFTHLPGSIPVWLEIYTGYVSNPSIAKSSECVLTVENVRNLDGCISDHQLSVLYSLQETTDSNTESITALQESAEATSTSVAELQEALASKADSITYDSESETLQLTSEGELIGDAVNIGGVIDEAIEENDGVIQFGDSDDYDSDDSDSDSAGDSDSDSDSTGTEDDDDSGSSSGSDDSGSGDSSGSADSSGDEDEEDDSVIYF